MCQAFKRRHAPGIDPRIRGLGGRPKYQKLGLDLHPSPIGVQGNHREDHQAKFFELGVQVSCNPSRTRTSVWPCRSEPVFVAVE